MCVGPAYERASKTNKTQRGLKQNAVFVMLLVSAMAGKAYRQSCPSALSRCFPGAVAVSYTCIPTLENLSGNNSHRQPLNWQEVKGWESVLEDSSRENLKVPGWVTFL